MSQKYEYEGIIEKIEKEPQTFASGFKKRSVVVCEDPSAKWKERGVFDFIKLGDNDMTTMLDRFRVGQKVAVAFKVSANESKKNPGQFFVGLRGEGITLKEEVTCTLPIAQDEKEDDEEIPSDMPF